MSEKPINPDDIQKVMKGVLGAGAAEKGVEDREERLLQRILDGEDMTAHDLGTFGDKILQQLTAKIDQGEKSIDDFTQEKQPQIRGLLCDQYIIRMVKNEDIDEAVLTRIKEPVVRRIQDLITAGKVTLDKLSDQGQQLLTGTEANENSAQSVPSTDDEEAVQTQIATSVESSRVDIEVIKQEIMREIKTIMGANFSPEDAATMIQNVFAAQQQADQLTPEDIQEIADTFGIELPDTQGQNNLDSPDTVTGAGTDGVFSPTPEGDTPNEAELSRDLHRIITAARSGSFSIEESRKMIKDILDDAQLSDKKQFIKEALITPIIEAVKAQAFPTRGAREMISGIFADAQESKLLSEDEVQELARDSILLQIF